MKKVILLLAANSLVFGAIGWSAGNSKTQRIEEKHAEAVKRADMWLGLNRGTLAVGHISLEALHEGNKEEAIRVIEGLTFSNLIFFFRMKNGLRTIMCDGWLIGLRNIELHIARILTIGLTLNTGLSKNSRRSESRANKARQAIPSSAAAVYFA